MDKLVNIAVNNFNIALKGILGDKIEDIIVHGSTIGGDFVPGKGDIDFIAILNQNVTDDEYNKIISYHHDSKLKADLESQLEGCYLVLCKENKIIHEGVYIGSTESGWKRFDGGILSSLDKALIKETSYSLNNKNYHQELFDFNWEDVKAEIKRNTDSTLELLIKITDLDFKLHALHTAARSFYTYHKEGFVSKIKALELLESEDDFRELHDFIKRVKQYKNMLSEDEKNEIIKLELSQIDRIVLKIKETFN